MFKNLRMVTIGFIIGVLFASGFVYAENIQASIMQCKIMFNSNYYDIKDPILNYNGKSYVPLREFVTMVDGSIDWSDETRTIYLKQDPKIQEVVLTKEVPKIEYKEIIKEIPKEVIKEIVREIPKEVIKEVYIEPKIKASKTNDGVYVVTDLDTYKTGYIFAFDNSNGLVTLKYSNGVEISKNYFNKPTQQSQISADVIQQSKKADYEAQLQILTNNYNNSLQDLNKREFEKIENTSDELNRSGWDNSYMGSGVIQNIKNEFEKERQDLKQNYDIQVKQLKIIYGVN